MHILIAVEGRGRPGSSQLIQDLVGHSRNTLSRCEPAVPLPLLHTLSHLCGYVLLPLRRIGLDEFDDILRLPPEEFVLALVQGLGRDVLGRDQLNLALRHQILVQVSRRWVRELDVSHRAVGVDVGVLEDAHIPAEELTKGLEHAALLVCVGLLVEEPPLDGVVTSANGECNHLPCVSGKVLGELVRAADAGDKDRELQRRQHPETVQVLIHEDAVPREPSEHVDGNLACALQVKLLNELVHLVRRQPARSEVQQLSLRKKAILILVSLYHLLGPANAAFCPHEAAGPRDVVNLQLQNLQWRPAGLTELIHEHPRSGLDDLEVHVSHRAVTRALHHKRALVERVVGHRLVVLSRARVVLEQH
mmetsp:Transcript_27926/g.65107  ORF Transcript_27926/g.65107 Transcript_27926/m.65107 type:complete len:362 (+) Transcript_27926:100-1185(+)